MRIAVDAMGSDNAPGPEVEGAVAAARRDARLELVLVGDRPTLEEALANQPACANISIEHASEVITMHDSAVQAVRQKKDSSLLVAMRMVKDGNADAIVSAGNTGAVQVAARIVLGPIRGVARSGICQQFPSLGPHNVAVIDLGGNVDCTARHLCGFAEMGMVYTSRTLRYENPRVGLVNIGEEQHKGNELAKTVHKYLRAANHINFIGNVEPKAIFNCEVDVAVCDGFVGNLLLKSSEAASHFVRTGLERELRGGFWSKVGGLLAIGAFRRMKRQVDPNDLPGAPLLGVNGTVIITHGSAKASGIENAILGAVRVRETKINEYIREEIEKLRRAEEKFKEA
jgi:glycerol-3-phosphate acyltransferase PlsX